MKQIFVILFSLGIFFTYGQTPVEKHGLLKVVGSQVVNKNNQKISLAGNSLFWSNYPAAKKFYNDQTVKHLAQEWNTSIVRAAMGATITEPGKPDQNGYVADLASGNTEEKDITIAVIEAAIKYGVYVIIDWHSHEAEQNWNKLKAIEFFTEMADKYGHYDNVIYEIYNEPINTPWPTIKSYAKEVIDAIRSKDPDNLIIVGTRTWSQRVEEASKDQIDDVNVAYTLHFYSAAPGHRQNLRDEALRAMNNGIAIFITEWGMSEAGGGGSIDYGATNDWMDFCKANYISHVNWSLSDVHESSAAINDSKGFEGLRTDDLRAAGSEAKKIIKNWNVPPVPVDPNQDQDPIIIGDSNSISIYAKGNCGNEEMKLSINGTEVKTWNNVSTTEKPYTFEYNNTINSIQIAFTNDGGSNSCGDRNLYVNKLVVGNTTLETETAASRIEGCGSDDWLWCNGKFLFDNLNFNPGSNGDDINNDDNNNSNVINIYAKGSCGNENMDLSINGTYITTWNNVSTTENKYSFTYTGGTINTVQIAFTNDGGSSSCGDRNLYVNKLVIGNTTLETETAATRTEGCGNAEWLWCNGKFLFSNLNLKTIAESEQGTLTLFPNPLSTNSLNLTLSGLKVPTEVQVSIYSIDGAEIYTKPVISSGEIHLTDIPVLDRGVYMVRTLANNFHHSAKLNIQ